MIENLEYVPGIGTSPIQLNGLSAVTGAAFGLRSREWGYDLGYRDLVNAMRPARTVSADLVSNYETANTLRRAADADVAARKPGTFVFRNEWRQRGYIFAAQPKKAKNGWLSTGLTIALLDGAWWRLVKRSFIFEEPVTTYDSATGETVSTAGAADAPLHALTVDGKAVQDGTPTPSSPVPIEVVERINLFNPTSTHTASAATVTINDGNITITSTSSASWHYVDYTIPAPKSFRFICDASSSTSYVHFSYLDNDMASLNSNAVKDTSSINLQKSSLPAGTVYIKIRFYTKSTSPGVVGDECTYSNIMLFEDYQNMYSYIPYGSIGLNIDGTITPIDLQGNVLASLPSGIKDELTVDASGHRVIKKRTVLLIYDGSEDESWAYESAAQGNFYIETASKGTAPNSYGNNIMCNYAAAASGPSVTKDHVRIGSGNSRYLNVALGSSLGINTAADFKTWLASNNLYVLAPLETEQEIDLGYITMPTVTNDSQVSIVAAVAPTITAEWQTSPDVYLDYPHDYEYDYQKTSYTGGITPSVFTPSEPYLVVYGPAVNPYVIVGGNRYQVNVTVPSGGYLIVDGREKTITLTLADGTVQNVFSSGVRGGGAGGGTYIFEKIPAGTSEVTFDGSFGFDLGWYEEEGEPPWSQS